MAFSFFSGYRRLIGLPGATVPVIWAIVLGAVGAEAKTDGTTGIPCGGIGAGAAKFCAHKGTFAMAGHTPTNKEYKVVEGMKLQAFTNRGGTIKTADVLNAVVNNGRSDDDACFPVQTANLGMIGEVAMSCTLFSPIDLSHVETMCYPYAFYEVTMHNTQQTPVDAAVAFVVPTGGQPIFAAGKGFGSTGGNERAIYGSSSDPSAKITAGNDNGFMEKGELNNTISSNVNKLAVKVTLGANETKTAKFVLAWYQGAEADLFFYTTAGTSAAAFAEKGLAGFDAFRKNALDLVTRMRASNIPEWLEDYTLNTLSTSVINSVHTKDKRYCHFEGQFDIMGTMDQMWHARQIHSVAFPSLAWQELEYWARTQWPQYAGQVHHDFGYVNGLCAWDDGGHEDYWMGYNLTHLWVDLDVGFLVGIWETFIATADTAKLNYFWPYAKKTGQRILDIAQQNGDNACPMTFNGTHSTYDAETFRNNGTCQQYVQMYNSGLSAVAYRIMANLAAIKGEADLRTKYNEAYQKVNESTVKRWLSNNMPVPKQDDWWEPWLWFECVMGGQWAAYNLKFGDLYPQQNLDYGLQCLNTYYNPASRQLPNTSGIWQTYLAGHYGGLLLQTGKYAEFLALMKQIHRPNYENRNRVFNQGLWFFFPETFDKTILLADNFASDDNYISVPVLWRNYYDLIGFHRNKFSGEVWIEPIILPEMNHELKNGLFISPEGLGSISCTESGADFTDREILIKCDNPMKVTTLYLRDMGGANAGVLVNGEEVESERIDGVHYKTIKVNWNGTIDDRGLLIHQYTGEKPVVRLQRGVSKPVRALVPTRPGAVYSLDGRLVCRAKDPVSSLGRLARSTYVVESGNRLQVAGPGTQFRK